MNMKIRIILIIVLTACFIPSVLFSQSDSVYTSSVASMMYEYILDNMSRIRIEQVILPDRGVIVEEIYYDSIYLGIRSIINVPDYREYSYYKTVKNKLSQYTIDYLQRQAAIANQGLIPDIELPIRLPTAIAGIIGQGGNLKISGSQRIEFGGSQSTDLNIIQTEYSQNNFLPELKMEQQLNVNLQGTIGQKINVFVDHNSEAQAELRNKIRLQYRGENDEVVHLIEMGHTQLSLPGTELIGMPPIQMGLFGIKSELQFANLNVIAIATKEEGKAESRTFIGQASQDSIMIYDSDYIRRQYYWLGLPGSDSGSIGPDDSILGLRVWIDDYNVNNNLLTGALFGNLHFYVPSTDSLIVPQGWFDLQEVGDFYSYDYLNNILELRTPLYSYYKLGVCYIIQRRDFLHTPYRVDTVGTWKDTYSINDTIDIKVLNPQNEKTYFPTWDIQLRNRYSLQSTAIVPGSFTLRIFKTAIGSGDDEETQGGITFLHLLGLDENENGLIDLEEGYVQFDKGYFTFPDTFPFENTVLLDPDSIIYDTTVTTAGRKYKLIMEYKGVRNVFSLGAINILEGSEVVTVNGERLTRNVDYTIDYNIGLITFITDKVNDPNAVVKIDFQYAPFFSLADKSLLGVRLDYEISPALSVGATGMYRTVGTKDEHPQLGREPRNITMGAMDLNLTFRPGFMTKAMDILPFISTAVPSLLTIRGAVATSMPNPNTKGFVYLDDMEGNKMSFNLGTNRTNWHFGSVPDTKDTSDLGMIYWYSPNDWFRKGDLNPNLPENERDDNIQVMSFVIDPQNDDPNSYVSVQQCFSTTGMDFSEFRFLEIWVYGDRGSVHFDLGYNIPEDIARRTGNNDTIAGYNNKLNTEDLNSNGILEQNEDVGLDNIAGLDANHVHGDEWNDDYPSNVQPSTYRNLKGTENNDRLDTEDLNNDGILNTSNDFIEYTIQPGGSQFLEIDRGNGWRLYKIPLQDSSAGVYTGNPDWTRMRYSRLWIEGFNSEDSVVFGSIAITGNRWRRNEVFSIDTFSRPYPGEYFEVTNKNNFENPDYYPPVDPGRDDLGNIKKEGSLVLLVKNLAHNRVASCYYYTTLYEDYNRYKRMKFWLHGNGDDGYAFLRIGGDTLTYYEYRVRIPDGWQEIDIEFLKFIDLKKSIEGDTTGIWSDGNYYIKTYGSSTPSLTKVNRLTLGMVDDVEGSYLDSTELWINDLRLISPYRNRGLSGNVSIGAVFGDILTLNATASYSDADYQRITEERGRGSNTTNYVFSGTFQSGKFFPSRWGINIPVTGSYSNSRSEPKFYPGSDIRLNPEEAEDQSSRSNTRTIAVNFFKATPSVNKILVITLDKVRASFNWSNTNSLTYNRADSNWTQTAFLSWGYAPSIPTIKFAGQEIGTFPRNLSFSSSYTSTQVRSHLIPDTSGILLSNYIQRYLTNTYSVSYNLLKPLSSTYTFSRNRDLEESSYILGKEVLRSQRVSTRYTPIPLQFIRPTLLYETYYVEDSRSELQTTADSTEIKNVSNTNTISFSTTLSFVQPFQWIGKIRDESRDSSAVIGSPQWILLNLSNLGRKITPLSFTISRTRVTRFYRLINRPDWIYQLGLTEGIDEEETEKQVSPNDYKSVTYNVTGGSGINLTNFSMGVNYSWAKSIGGNVGNKTVNLTMTWPRLTFTFQHLQRLIKIPAIETSNISSGFSHTLTYTGPEGEDPTRKTSNYDLSPLLSVQIRWKNGLNTNFSMTRSLSDIDNRGAITTLTRQENNNYSAIVSYTFSAPGGLPLLGNRIRFTSLLTLSLAYRLNLTREYYRTSGENISYRSNYSIIPTTSYNFSQNVVGGINANYSLNEDRQTGRKIRNVGLSAFAEFRF